MHDNPSYDTVCDQKGSTHIGGLRLGSKPRLTAIHRLRVRLVNHNGMLIVYTCTVALFPDCHQCSLPHIPHTIPTICSCHIYYCNHTQYPPSVVAISTIVITHNTFIAIVCRVIRHFVIQYFANGWLG